MANWPDFLPTTRPVNPIVTYGDELSVSEINLLRFQMQSLHFHPIILVLPRRHHVTDGDALVAEVAKGWSLRPHGMLIVYSPSTKEVWATCGKFNASAGVDPAFFKRDFSQRMAMDSRDGNLYAALNSSLLDVDRVIVSSQAYATRAVNHQRAEREHQAHQAHHSPAFPFGQVLPAIVLAILLLRLIAKASQPPAPRRRLFDEQISPSADLGGDLERIERLTQSGAGGHLTRPGNSQVPMAEFKKRASAPAGVRNSAAWAGRSTDAGLDAMTSQAHAAAPVSTSVSVPAAGAVYKPVSVSEPAPTTAAASAKTALSSSFDSQSASTFTEPAWRPGNADSKAEFDSSGGSGYGPSPTEEFSFSGSGESAVSASSSRQPDGAISPPSRIANTAVTDGNTAMPERNTAMPERNTAMPERNTAMPDGNTSMPYTNTSTPAESYPDVLGSFGLAGSSLAASKAGVLQPDGVDCPKCSEPKTKDFSFCLKCGHNF